MLRLRVRAHTRSYDRAHPLAQFIDRDTRQDAPDGHQDRRRVRPVHHRTYAGDDPPGVPQATCPRGLCRQRTGRLCARLVSDFSPRKLYEVVVELLVELIDRAIGHADDEAAAREFEVQLVEFDVKTFIDIYRDERNFKDKFDIPASPISVRAS